MYETIDLYPELSRLLFQFLDPRTGGPETVQEAFLDVPDGLADPVLVEDSAGDVVEDGIVYVMDRAAKLGLANLVSSGAVVRADVDLDGILP